MHNSATGVIPWLGSFPRSASPRRVYGPETVPAREERPMPAASDYMRDLDIQTFKAAAKLYNVWILVRESNPAARQYIGVKGYSPKRLDCKAKTAKRDVELSGGLGT